MTATVISFPTFASHHRRRFTPQDRNAIIAAAMALSPEWGASFFNDDDGELASIGPRSGGAQASDRFGLAFVGSDRIELVVLDHPEVFTWHRTVAEAVKAMRELAARSSSDC